MFKSPFKPLKYNVFNYKPRYYNPRKERLEKLKRQYEKEDAAGGSDETEKQSLDLSKNNLKNDWILEKRQAGSRAATLRLAIIIAILVGVVAYLFKLHTLF